MYRKISTWLKVNFFYESQRTKVLSKNSLLYTEFTCHKKDSKSVKSSDDIIPLGLGLKEDIWIFRTV